MIYITSIKDNSSLEVQERLVFGTILLLIGGFIAFDVYEDWSEGVSFGHIIPEVIIIILTASIAAYSFVRFTCLRKALAEEKIALSTKEAEEWRGKTRELRKGLSEAVSRQLIEWRLSSSEQEIAFMLIKGLSLNEISEIRQTSQQTIRQQASVIYKKSGLAGRAQLSAYFLEDFLIF